jgi:ribosomal protein S18 acetylase RimI-like enzyme
MAARLRLRRLRLDDVDACARIVSDDPLWRRYGLTMPRARAAFRRALAAGRRAPAAGRHDDTPPTSEVVVASDGRRVLGFIWYRVAGTFDHSGYIRWVAVAGDARGRGVGARLLAHAERRIFRQGPNAFLMVSHFNRRAQAFYRRTGYTKVGEIPDYVVPGVTEYLFRKTHGPIAARRRARARRAETIETRRRDHT